MNKTEEKDVDSKLFDKGWNITPSAAEPVKDEGQLTKEQNKEQSLSDKTPQVPETKEPEKSQETAKQKGEDKSSVDPFEKEIPEDKTIHDEKNKDEEKEDYEQKWKSQKGIVKSLKDEISQLKQEIKQTNKAPSPVYEDPLNKNVASSPEVIRDKKAFIKGFYEAIPSLKQTQETYGDDLAESIIDVASALIQHFDYKFNQVNSVIVPSVQKEFEQNLAKIHPDFQKYRDDGEILEWIESLPEYKKKVYKDKYYQSNLEDAVDLLNDFKSARGYSNNGNKNRTDVDTKREEELRRMAEVKTKNRPIKAFQPSNEKTFESGWNLKH